MKVSGTRSARWRETHSQSSTMPSTASPISAMSAASLLAKSVTSRVKPSFASSPCCWITSSSQLTVPNFSTPILTVPRSAAWAAMLMTRPPSRPVPKAIARPIATSPLWLIVAACIAVVASAKSLPRQARRRKPATAEGLASWGAVWFAVGQERGASHSKGEAGMDVRAAVAHQAGAPLSIETVQLEGPKAGEGMVEIPATGICHTDEFTLSGADPEGIFPAILGHEGAGVVVEVGPGVKSLKVGDHVIPLYTPECRECEYCLNPKTNLCQAIRATQGKGLMPDGTSRFRQDGKKVHHYMGTSTFSNFTVLPEIAVAKIREDAPFDKVCYVGCGVTTGVGAVINTAKVEPGSNCIVFGLGGIGLNVIQGLRLVGANMIIGVDLNPEKKAWGEKFGMTHFVNPKEVGTDLVPHLVNMTKRGADQIGGADYTFDCTGSTKVMRQALEASHRGWGKSVVIGVAESGHEISTRPFQLITGRVWKGTAFGGARGRTDVPKIV